MELSEVSRGIKERKKQSHSQYFYLSYIESGKDIELGYENYTL